MTFVDTQPDTGALQGNPVDGLPAPGADSGEGLGSEPQGERLDVDSYGDHLVPVKIDGEEQLVPLSELREGHMRHKDYTQKTQQLADERKRLQQYEALEAALEEDPQRTLRALANAYGFPLEGGQQTQESLEEELDPQDQELRAVKAELQELRSHMARSSLEQELDALDSQYGEVDRQEVLKYARQRGVSPTDAYKALRFDEILAKTTEQECALQEQKRSISQATHRGGSTNRGSLRPQQNKKMSLRDSFLTAVDQANKGQPAPF
jgi:hypothetical protein